MRLCQLFFIGLLSFSILPHTVTGQDRTAADSARAVQAMQKEQQNLMKEMKQLREELNTVKQSSSESGEGNTAKIEELEQRLSVIESRMNTLSAQLQDYGVESQFSEDDWDKEWKEWEEEWDDDFKDWSADTTRGWSKDWSLWDDKEDDEQFDMKQNFFKKYPGNFPWLFPVISRIQESFLRYNRVEGLYIGIAQPKRLYWHSKPVIVSSGSIGYGFLNHRWRYHLGLYLPIYLEDHIIEIGGEGHSFTDSRDEWIIDRDENSVTAFFAREDYMDYFSREGYNINAAWYFRAEGDVNLRATAAYLHDTYRSMERRTNWSLFGGDKVFRENPRINDANINSIALGLGFTTLSSINEREHGWDVNALYETAGGFSKGDYEFSQAVLDVRRYQPLFEHLNLNLRGRMAVSDGTIPIQRAVDLGGVSTLPGYGMKEFTGSHAALFNAEIILRSSIAGDVQGWMKGLMRMTNLIVFFDAGAVNHVQPTVSHDFRNGSIPVSMSESFVLNDWKSDIGIALGSSEGAFRIGAAWRMDRAENPSFILRFTRPF